MYLVFRNIYKMYLVFSLSTINVFIVPMYLSSHIACIMYIISENQNKFLSVLYKKQHVMHSAI